jgi:hypothetical protein
MLALTKLWQAVGTLTANVAALAATVADTNAGLHQGVGLDGRDPLDVPSVTHQPAPDGSGGGETGPRSSPAPRVRRKAQDAA